MTIRNVADSVIFVEKGNKLLIGGYDINRKRMPSEEFYQGRECLLLIDQNIEKEIGGGLTMMSRKAIGGL